MAPVKTGSVLVDGSGSGLSVGSICLGGDNNTGSLTLQNGASGSAANLSVADDFVDGYLYLGSGTVAVNSGDTLALSGNVNVGLYGNASTLGTISVGGSGVISSITQAGTTTLRVGSVFGPGSGPQGLLAINGSGTFTTGSGGMAINPSGTVSVSNFGTLNVNGDIAISGGVFNCASSGAFGFFGSSVTVQSGGRFTYRGSSELFVSSSCSVTGAGSTLQIPNAPLTIEGSMNVASGGTLSCQSFASWYSTTITGPGSEIVVADQSLLGVTTNVNSGGLYFRRAKRACRRARSTSTAAPYWLARCR